MQKPGAGDLENIVENPIDAYNTFRVGLSVSSLAELATYAHIRLPDISERAKGGAGRHGTQQVVDARMAYVWPPGVQTLDLLTKCLVSLQDRFYKLDEIAIVIFAAIRSNKVLGFLILDFSGNAEEFVGNMAVVQIMTKLGNMFYDNLRRAANRGEPQPTLQFDGQLRIPEGFASLGDRRLNAMMVNLSSGTMAETPWRAGSTVPKQYGWQTCHHLRPEGQDKPPSHQHLRQPQHPAGSSEQATPIPPAPPAKRRGRSRTPNPGQTRDPAANALSCQVWSRAGCPRKQLLLQRPATTTAESHAEIATWPQAGVEGSTCC